MMPSSTKPFGQSSGQPSGFSNSGKPLHLLSNSPLFTGKKENFWDEMKKKRAEALSNRSGGAKRNAGGPSPSSLPNMDPSTNSSSRTSSGSNGSNTASDAPNIVKINLPTPQQEDAFSKKHSTPEPKSTKKKWFTRLMVGLGILIPSGLVVNHYASKAPEPPGTVQVEKKTEAQPDKTAPQAPAVKDIPKSQPAQPAPPKDKRLAGDADIDPVRHPFVNQATDIPYVNQDMKQVIVDLAKNPLLSPNARMEVQRLLDDFNRTSGGKMAVVIIPDTQQKDLSGLALDIFKQIKIGDAGKNDGVLMLLNSQAIREGRKDGRIHLLPGNGLDSKLVEEKAMALLTKHALPHLQNKNYDEAVVSTVRGISEYLKPDNAAQIKSLNNGTSAVKVIVGIVALIAVLFAAAVVIDLSTRSNDFVTTYLLINVLSNLVELAINIALIAASGGNSSGSSSSSGGGSSGGGGSGL
jgi:uncharacterized membrane protein YgcG